MTDLIHFICCPCHVNLDDLALWLAPLAAPTSLVLSRVWLRVTGARR
jgi:hypothetical protein